MSHLSLHITTKNKFAGSCRNHRIRWLRRIFRRRRTLVSSITPQLHCHESTHSIYQNLTLHPSPSCTICRSQGAGYGLVIAFGVVFSIVTSGLIWLEFKFVGGSNTSEAFNTAGRTVKTGLIANVIVSQWTWAATLLQSSNVAWQYGVSGPFWYASGATIQIILFGILAVAIKRRAPNAHTLLEIIRARWGDTAHKVFFVFAIMTNIIVTAMLLLGGASVMNALTGMDIYAACMLIPVGVILYTAVGGLKATFMASCVNSFYVLIMLCLFSLAVYAGDDEVLGSPSRVWENLTKFVKTPSPAGAPANLGLGPVADNKEGSFLTMFSEGGLIFGVINIIGNFGTVFVDQSYYMGAIASKPSASWKGYILGGLMWFSIPFTLATSLGLGSRAAGLPVNSGEAGSGLVPPATAVYLFGSSGAWLIALMMMMAVTSTANSELIAVSSLISYDIYRTYINPKATGAQIIKVSRIGIVAFGIFMGIIAIILLEIGLNLGWVYLFMGIAIGGAVAPIYFCLTWEKASAMGAIVGAIVGTCAGFATWLITCQAYYGSINVDNLGGNYPMLGGNLASIIISLVVCAVISYLKPQNYDWKTTREIALVEEEGTSKDEDFSGEDSKEAMDKAAKYMLWACWGLTLILVVAWPLLALPAGVFSKGYFTFWVILSIIWGLLATIVGIVLPFWESRDAIAHIVKGLATCSPSVQAPTIPAQQAFPTPSFGKLPEEK
jgi:urea-proton symporter